MEYRFTVDGIPSADGFGMLENGYKSLCFQQFSGFTFG